MKNALAAMVEKNGMETVLAALAEMLRNDSSELYNEEPEHVNVEKMDEVAELLESACLKYTKIEAV